MSNHPAVNGEGFGLSSPSTQASQSTNFSGNSLISNKGDEEINLRGIFLVFKRRKKLIVVTFSGVFLFTVLLTAYQRIFKPVYQGSFALLITDPMSSDNGKASPGNLDETMFEQLARNTTNNDIPTLIELLKSPLLLSPIAKRFNINANVLARRVNIRTGGVTRQEADGVLKVSIKGRDPIRDKELLTALSNAYLQAALEQRQQRLADGLGFLNRQAPALQAKTEEIQSELAAFRRKHSLLEPTTEGSALKEREAVIAAEVLELEAGRDRLLRVKQEISNGTLTARGFQEVIGGIANNQLQGLTISDVDQSLLQQLLKVETELAEARSKFNSNSSMIRGLEARLQQLQPLLRKNQLEAVDAALSLNYGRLKTAKLQETALNKQFLQQPSLIKEYDALQTRLTIAQENLTGLVSARENFQLEIAQRSVPWRLIDPPEINLNPIKPSVPRNLVLGGFLGLVAGITAALLRDRLDHVFHNTKEVKNELNIPLLGHIPHVEEFKDLRNDKRYLLDKIINSNNTPSGIEAIHTARYQRFIYKEAFRNLYTSIRFLNSDSPLRSLALSSSIPAEGKTLVIVLLAKTLSELGKRVLLIDADLRKPQLHTRLGLNNVYGLTNILTDENHSWPSVIQKINGHESWGVITAGNEPPDPTRLLSSQRMHQLVEDVVASNEYDLVLFDTPPIHGLADAALVAEHCDGLILLVSLNRVDRALPKEAVMRVISSGAPLLGMVTNCIKPKDKDFDTYGYSPYGYKYGYGYGYIAENSQHTSNEGITSTKQNEKNKKRFAKNFRASFRHRRQQLMSWLDN